MENRGRLACETFSATKMRDRENLGEEVTEWLRDTGIVPEECHVRQSSDAAFHCLTIVVFYRVL